MPLEIVPDHRIESTPQAWVDDVRYVARQPILNLQGRVHGYELLFRNSPDSVGQGAGASGDREMATQTMLDNGVIFGLERFTNSLPAFVICTAEALTEKLVNVLAPTMTVLAIPSSMEFTPALEEACLELKKQGFRLAIDDFNKKTKLHTIVKLADYVRVDFSRFNEEEREYLKEMNFASNVLVAKRVDTQEDYREACTKGFTLFQGDYFCHPVLLKKHKIPANRLFHFEIVRLLHHDPIDVRQVAKLVRRDAALTFRLLRLVNSPLYAIQKEMRSIESAIFIVGEDALRRMVSLAVLSEMNTDSPPEILQMALVRARFCELAAGLFDLEPAEQYLLGMLSLVPAMLCLPVEELIPSLPLSGPICEALQGTANTERSLLSWLECHERGDWDACDAIIEAVDPARQQLNRKQLILCYADAVVWAQTALRSAA
jgi:EAL and modified HD-GYP domain-containing signal transduction protein